MTLPSGPVVPLNGSIRQIVANHRPTAAPPPAVGTQQAILNALGGR